MQLTPEEKLILLCVKVQPTQLELEQLNILILQIEDWEYLITTIIARGIGPLFFKKLALLSNRSQIPATIQTKLQQVYYKTFTRSTILYEHFRKIGEVFAKHGISVIALKGIYLSECLYQDIGLRQFSDIDLLVKKEDASLCLSIMAEQGYKPSDSGETEFVKAQAEIVHYPPMVLDGVSMEIHIKLHKNSESYNLTVEDLWKNSLPATINNTSIYALSNNDLLIHLCVHLDKHFRVGHVQFTCFNDIANLLDKYSESFDWNQFIETCKNYNCELEVFKYILLSNKYMNATVPEYIIQKYNLLLTKEDEDLFFKYLRGYTHNGFGSQVSTHIGNLKKLSTYSGMFRYVWDILFPSKEFMIQKYNINDKRLVISDK